MTTTAGWPGQRRTWLQSPGVLGILGPTVLAYGEGIQGLCPVVPDNLRPFQKSPFALRIPYKFFLSSQPPGLQTCGSSVGDISTLTDVEP